jgi:Kef-type K+ transport system membrane component KefB
LLLANSLTDIALVATLALSGFFARPLSSTILGILALVTVGFALTVAFLKRPVFRRLKIDRRRVS